MFSAKLAAPSHVTPANEVLQALPEKNVEMNQVIQQLALIEIVGP